MPTLDALYNLKVYRSRPTLDTFCCASESMPLRLKEAIGEQFRRNLLSGMALSDAKQYPYLMLDPEITAEAYLEQSGQPSAPLLLDVREPWEVHTASLPNSVLMPMGEVPSRAHQELDPDQPIVVLCHHGARSLSVTMWLRDQGFEHVQSLAGGIDRWSRAIDPSIPRY